MTEKIIICLATWAVLLLARGLHYEIKGYIGQACYSALNAAVLMLMIIAIMLI